MKILGRDPIHATTPLMGEIGAWLEAQEISERVVLIHDQGHDDRAALEAFKVLVDDPRWKYHELFTSIQPMKWSDDVGLQAADMIAFETFKETKRQLFAEASGIRKSLAALRNRLWHLYAFQLDRGVLEEVLKIEEEGREND
jgi:hypothetical protein